MVAQAQSLSPPLSPSPSQAVYTTMEEEFDRCGPDSAPAVHAVWHQHGDQLRRGPMLAQDLADVTEGAAAAAAGTPNPAPGPNPNPGPGPAAPTPALTPAAAAYVSAIRTAGALDRADGGGRLLGHMYCRYFADLFGGQVLGAPTRAALRLPERTPRHYRFDFRGGTRRDLIEGVYTSLNAASDSWLLGQTDCDTDPDMKDKESGCRVQHATDEALLAFRLNAELYSEEPIYLDAARGIANVIVGFVTRPAQLLGFFGGLHRKA